MQPSHDWTKSFQLQIRIVALTAILIGACSTATPPTMTHPSTGFLVVTDSGAMLLQLRSDTVLEVSKASATVPVVGAATALASLDDSYDPMCNRFFRARQVTVVLLRYACDVPGLQPRDAAIAVAALDTEGRVVSGRVHGGWNLLKAVYPADRPPWDPARARQSQIRHLDPPKQ